MKQTTLHNKVLPGAKEPKKSVKLQLSHLRRFGLKIGGRHVQTGEVESVICRFCVLFGREDQIPHASTLATDADGKKTRKKPISNKHFSSFRTDMYDQHRTQHPRKWQEYQGLDGADQESFFGNNGIPYAEPLPASYPSDEPISFVIPRPVVDVVIGGLLFHPDDVEGVSRARALSTFKLDGSVYQVQEKNATRFRLTVRFISRGATFRMAAGLLEDTKDETAISRFGGCTDAVAARYARVVCGASLARLGQVLASVWAFAVALDCGTHQGKGYVDVRCRFTQGGALHNFHLLAIPLYARHTAANIFDVVCRFLDAVFPKWRCNLVGVATDGAATMTGSISGVATRLEAEPSNPVTRVWCGLHQLNLKMQLVFKSALSESYLDKLTELIGYLRRQQSLVTEMRSTCPKVASTRWLSMYQVAHWLCENVHAVRQHLDAKQALCAPSDVWWVSLFAIREVARESNAVFISLQGMSTLVRQQRDRFSGLVHRLCDISGVTGPIEASEIESVRTTKHEVSGSFMLSYEDAVKYIEGSDLWVCEVFSTLPAEKKTVVTTAVAKMFTLAVSSIHALTFSDEKSPPVTPRDLIGTTMPEFLSVIRRYRGRLGSSAVYDVGQEFKKLQRQYADEYAFRVAIDSFDHRLAMFDAMWQIGDATPSIQRWWRSAAGWPARSRTRQPSRLTSPSSGVRKQASEPRSLISPSKACCTASSGSVCGRCVASMMRLIVRRLCLCDRAYAYEVHIRFANQCGNTRTHTVLKILFSAWTVLWSS